MQHPDSGHSDDRFSEAIYNELRRRAQFYLRGERAGHPLQPTEIVHEAWLRISSAPHNLLLDRTRFLALAGCIMRNILVDCARRRGAVRHGGDMVRADFNAAILFSQENYQQILEVDRALSKLALIDMRTAQIVELRFFAGLTESEVAATLNMSERSVKRDWSFAKAWMRTSLGGNQLES